MNVRARYSKSWGGEHVHIRVFVGKGKDYTHAKAGELTLREDEFETFKGMSPTWEWIEEPKAGLEWT